MRTDGRLAGDATSVDLDAARGADFLAEGASLVERTNAAGVPLRLVGGVAIALHCDRLLQGRPHRDFGDLDAVTPAGSSRRLTAALVDCGYEPDTRFNAMQGEQRLIFEGPLGKLDVFVGLFQMCHRIDLSKRLELDSPTISVADLSITKLQIVELNEKDAVDTELLLREHELGEGHGDHIDTTRLAEVVRDDWGLWRTMTKTLATLKGRGEEIAADRAAALLDVLDDAPKSRGFKLRARVGERVRWYELPDEVG